jgi:hypothetical protein
MWFAGGGIKGRHGGWGNRRAWAESGQDVYHVRDVHATILDVMGLEDMRLTYYYAGRNRRLTDTGGRRIPQVLS